MGNLLEVIVQWFKFSAQGCWSAFKVSVSVMVFSFHGDSKIKITDDLPDAHILKVIDVHWKTMISSGNSEYLGR